MEALLRHFFPEARLLASQPLGKGNINDTYRIDFQWDGAAHTYVLQRLNQHVFPQTAALMDNLCRVCAHLSAQPDYAYRVVAPCRTTDGQHWCSDANGQPWRMFPFVAGSFAPEALPDVAVAREAGRAYGAFARALRHFPASALHETIPGFHDTERRWAYFEQCLRQATAERSRPAEPELAAIREALPVFETIAHLKKSGHLPLRVTHNDAKAGNILFDENTHKALAVIDLDTVMPGTLLSDFGDMVRSFSPDQPEDAPAGSLPQLRSAVLQALHEAFLAETADFLHPAEKEHLMLGAAWMTGEQALRFLSDWLAGDVYYKTRYPGQNLDRARNQLALFRHLAAFRPVP
jgi:aminoglycoside phosphotransferase (APT) family kinase protein